MAFDKEFIDSQKTRLLSEKDRLAHELSDASKYPEIGTSDDDREQEVARLDDNLAVGGDLELEKGKVDRALKRIDDGSYGKCSKCNQEIPRDRLKAYPAADTCFNCSKK